MARPKERLPVQLGQAFKDRCEREIKKIKTTLAKQLWTDLSRLYSESLHSDLCLKHGPQEFAVHRFIIKARNRKIFERLSEICQKDDDDTWIVPEWISQETCSSVIRYLYGMSSKDTESLDLDTNFTTWDYLLSLLNKPKHPIYNGEESQNDNSSTNIIIEESCNHSSKDSLSGTELKSNTKSVDKILVNCDENIENDEHSHDNGLISEEESSSRPKETNPNGDSGPSPQIYKSNDGTHQEECKRIVNSSLEDCHYNDVSSTNGNHVTLPDLIKMTYDLTVPYETCSDLGEDLLRGFLQDMDYDCIISVSGAHFKTHKCILSARSLYFEAMLSGSWKESKSQEIILEGITPGAMEQTLLYMYGGVVEINPECNVGELIVIADMYGLEELKEIVYFHMKKTFCHFFHKPCSECEVGVPEGLSYAVMYNMKELQDKCIKWINNHKVKVWCTKSFANLHGDVMDLCYKAVIAEMNISNVLETMLDCQKMNRTIPRLKWSEPSLHLITSLMEKATEYTSQNFNLLLTGPKFRDIDKGLAHKIGLLEELLEIVIDSLPVEGACTVFTRLSNHLATSKLPEEANPWSEEFCDFVQKLYSRSETFMKKHIHQIVRSAKWKDLPLSTQTQLLESANFVCIDKNEGNKMAPRRLSSMKKAATKSSTLLKKQEPSTRSLGKPGVRSQKANGFKSKAKLIQKPESSDQAMASYSEEPNDDLSGTGASESSDTDLLDKGAGAGIGQDTPSTLQEAIANSELEQNGLQTEQESQEQDFEALQELVESFTFPEPVHSIVEFYPLLQWNFYPPNQ